MTKRHRSVSAKQRRWRADFRPLLHLDYEDRLRSDPRAAIAFKKFRSWGATDDDIEGPAGIDGTREGGMIHAFAAIPFIWYVKHLETEPEWRQRHESLAKDLLAIANRIKRDPCVRQLALSDLLTAYAHLLRQPERFSPIPEVPDRKESLERFAFRFVLNYLAEHMPSQPKRRRPMNETKLIVGALLGRSVNSNNFQRDPVLEKLWRPKTYSRTHDTEIDEK